MSSLSIQFPQVSNGIRLGVNMVQMRSLEGSVMAGANARMGALFQNLQGTFLLEYVNRYAKATNSKPPLLYIKGIVLLAPIGLAALDWSESAPEKIRPLLLFIQMHIGKVYQTAAIVYSIALYSLGQTYFAASSITLLTLGFMDQWGFLPTELRILLHTLTPYLQVLSGLNGFYDLSKVSQILIALNLISLLTRPIFAFLNRNRSTSSLEGKQLNYENMQHIHFENTQINPAHLHVHPTPPVPDIDLDELLNVWDQFRFNITDLRFFRTKLSKDEKFFQLFLNKNPKNLDKMTDQELLGWIRKNLATFILNIKNRSILKGEPKDYQPLENYVKIITHFINECKDHVQRIDLIMRLAIDAGTYCGPKQFEVTENIVSEISLSLHEFSFEDKVLLCFENLRTCWIQNLYNNKLTKTNLTIQMLDRYDLHQYNQFLNLFCNRLGIRRASADQDETALVGPIKKLILYFTLEEIIKQRFLGDYTKDHLLQEFRKALGTPRLPKPGYYNYWVRWVCRQSLSDERKEELLDELSRGRLLGTSLESDRWIHAMLVDMGILQKS